MLMASQNDFHNNIVIIKIPLSKGRQYNFLTLGSDNHITTPFDFHTLSNKQVRRILRQVYQVVILI